MQAVTPYLIINGNAAEAMDFYVQALDGTIVHSQTFGESGMPINEDANGKIMHS